MCREGDVDYFCACLRVNVSPKFVGKLEPLLSMQGSPNNSFIHLRSTAEPVDRPVSAYERAAAPVAGQAAVGQRKVVVAHIPCSTEGEAPESSSRGNPYDSRKLPVPR